MVLCLLIQQPGSLCTTHHVVALLRTRAQLHIYFTTLLNQNISLLLTQLQAGVCTQNFFGWVAAAAQPLLSPTCRSGEGKDDWGGHCGTAAVGVTRGYFPQLCPECTWGGRDGAAMVSYANKELAIYHLTCCGTLKHKLFPSPIVFSASGRRHMMPHIKAATHDNFQRKRLYMPKPWRPVDQYATVCDRPTRTFPSAGKGSWGLLIIF